MKNISFIFLVLIKYQHKIHNKIIRLLMKPTLFLVVGGNERGDGIKNGDKLSFLLFLTTFFVIF